MKTLSAKRLKITLKSGLAGKSESQRKILNSLGLRKIGQSKVLPNLNPILGQINKVINFVAVAEVDE